MDDLRQMDACRPVIKPTIPAPIGTVITPLQLAAWESELQQHPDREFVAFILQGIVHGFRIGFDYSSKSCIGARRNMLSATQHPDPIDKYMTAEIQAGRFIGPLPPEAQGIHISRCGVIPKPHQPGKWRVITDLSHPKGNSVNDGIDPLLCSLSYISIDTAAQRIVRLGKGTLLAKFDLENAYRVVPVHPVDRLLLGVQWKGETYVDGALPFGLRSAPKLFTAIADALLWILGRHAISDALHYLDDYLIMGPPDSKLCGHALQTSLEVCHTLGLRIAEHKLDGPATAIPFLGILIDTADGTLKLPPEKLSRLRSLLASWRGRKCCKKRELLSLIGQLQHASRVVRSGRTFLRRMIDLSSVPKELHHRVRLNVAFRSDLQWWSLFLADWNGISLLSSVCKAPPSATVTSDASGGWGCGAFTTTGEWFQFQWPPSWKDIHITVKELLPIIVACAVWGKQWRGKTICCLCDNAAVVAILRSGTSKNPLAMHLMRCLFFYTASHQLILTPQHVPGKLNTAADHLSRNGLPSFLQLVPTAKSNPTPLPHLLMQALVHQRPDWTSDSWRTVLHSTLQMD